MVNYTWDRNLALVVDFKSLLADERVKKQIKAAAKYGPKMTKAANTYNNAFFLSLSTPKLIDFCQSPPKDCEFNELKTAADILATRYKACIEALDKF